MDLLAELPASPSSDELLRLRSRLAVRLVRRMVERRIDAVMAATGAADERLIVADARRQALELAHTAATRCLKRD